MNKSLFASDVDVPPLLLLSLAVTSLVFNLCFPQYSASASTRTQRFTAENGLEESEISLGDIKAELDESVSTETKSEIQPASEEQVFAQLKPEAAQPATKKAAKQRATTTAGASAASHWVTVTAYSSTADQCDSNPFTTASGTHVRDGVIATNLLAFGTKVKFPSIYGDKIFVVEDRMSRRFSNRADIWFSTREEATRFGVRKLEMVIVS